MTPSGSESLMPESLLVVMPVNNEETVLRHVITEWMPALAATSLPFTLLAINDGSSDSSLHVLNDLSEEFPQLEVFDQPNAGHGPSCLRGYQLGVDRRATWIMQLDSDGQCDPAFFSHFWAMRNERKPVYGFRTQRDDGFLRVVMSRALCVLVYLATGTWIRDANVPYRLMHHSILTETLKLMPEDVVLANVVVAVLQGRQYGIDWVDIHFRERLAGHSSHKLLATAKAGYQLYRILRRCRLLSF